MVQIISQPYNKTYLFPLFSFTFFVRAILLAITIAAPFFIVYQTGNFYQNTKTQYVDLYNVKLKPTYQYYITIKTSTQSYIFTNFFVNNAYQPITIKFQQQELNSLKIKVQYPKKLSEKVKQINIFVGFQYIQNSKLCFGLIKSNLKGYDLAQGTIIGLIQFKDGTGKSPVLKSDNVLKTNQFDLIKVYETFYKSSSYLNLKYNAVPISLPSDIFKLNLIMNYPTIKVEQKTPSILGQLIWSWIQYFPILFVFYIVTDKIWLFLLRQGLLKRTIKHDKDYLQVLRKEQDRQTNFSYY